MDKPGTDGREERVNVAGSLPRLKPGILTGAGRKKEGNRSNADNKGVESSAAANENRSDWGSTTSASAKLLLRGVRDSADAFPPLKSVAGGLCFILENYEVRSPLSSVIHIAYRCPSERRQTIRGYNRWHPGSEHSKSHSAKPFLRMM